MQIHIINKPPQTRCYICGSSEIDMVCHHCLRAMCKLHGPATMPKIFYYHDREFENLLLDNEVGTQGIHCHDCIHYVRSYRWVTIIGALIFGMGLVGFLLERTQSDFIGMFVYLMMFMGGVSLTIWGGRLHEKWHDLAFLNTRPPLPIIGKPQNITINEEARGYVVLNEQGVYSYPVLPFEAFGFIDFSLQFTRHDLERWDKYQQIYQSRLTRPLSFDAGFLVLQEAADLNFVQVSNRLSPVNTLRLSGNIEHRRFFTLRKLGRHSYLTLNYPYSFNLIQYGINQFFIQLVPTLVHEGEEWGIELTVQINPKLERVASSGTLPSIEEFIVYTPVSLGKVEKINPPANSLFDTQKGEYKTIWKNISVNEGKPGVHYRSFYLRFEHTITRDTILNGKLRVAFENTLSGISGVRLFYPLGNSRSSEEIQIEKRTRIILDFKLHLGSLNFPRTKPYNKVISWNNVVPDHHLLTKLINAVSENNIYVQRIIENTPRTDKMDAKRMKRFWDVIGRRYQGVYPIDFHLVITGQEWHENADTPPKGRTTVEISVQGTAINETMEAHIKNLRDDLRFIMRDVVQKNIKMSEEILDN